MTLSTTLRVRGIPAGPGIEVGPVAVLDRRGRSVPSRTLPESELDAEVARLRRAIDSSAQAVAAMRDSVARQQGESAAALLDPLLFMHRDPLLVETATELVMRERTNAEHAISRAVSNVQKSLSESTSSYFRERADDVEHVGRHVLRALAGERRSLVLDGTPTVLVASDLSPAEAAALQGSAVRALVLTTGSATSHTALMARSLGIPAVVGARMLPIALVEGRVAIVDGLRGEVIISPGPELLEDARARAERFRAFAVNLRARRDPVLVSEDGERVELLANLDLPSDVGDVVAHGIAGVGLYRTEYLYLQRRTLPDEALQLEVYSRIVRALEGRPLTLRTFDFGGDKLRPEPLAVGASESPLGRAGLRFSLLHPDVLRTQVRAILRASALGPVAMMFPRVARRAELDDALELVARCRRELEEEGVAIGQVPVGVMIEVPSAALLADRLAPGCDFFSVGTNDLTQFTLAADRSDTLLAESADPLDPAVLALLDMTARAASRASLPLSMCGDMANDPLALPVVLGLGYVRLSMPRDLVPIVAESVRRLSLGEARGVAREALTLVSAAEVRGLVYDRFFSRLGDLWDEQGVLTGHSP